MGRSKDDRNLLGQTSLGGDRHSSEDELLDSTKLAGSSWTDSAPHLSSQRARLEEGTLLGDRFELLTVLGQGGMGVVWEARDRQLDRPVALKFLSRTLLNQPEAIRQFKAEVAQTQQLTDAGIVRVYDLHDLDGHVFFSMERVDGSSLLEMVRTAQTSRRRVVPAVAARIVESLLTALEYAHGEDVVHLDVKPSNVMLVGYHASQGLPTSPPRVKLLDFGIAQAVRSPGVVSRAGTPAYMAPELEKGESVDHRADLFSVGAVLYELLTLDRPRGRYARVADRRSDCPAHADKVIDRALNPDPNKRYQSAREFLLDLQPEKFPGSPPLQASALNPSSPGSRARLPRAVPQRTLERFRPGAGARRSAADLRAVDPDLGNLASKLKKNKQ